MVSLRVVRIPEFHLCGGLDECQQLGSSPGAKASRRSGERVMGTASGLTSLPTSVPLPDGEAPPRPRQSALLTHKVVMDIWKW